MGDYTDQEHDAKHGGLLSHLSTKQKLIGGALAGVVGLALVSAHKRGTATAGENTGAVTVPNRIEIPVPIIVPGPISGGGLPPIITPPIFTGPVPGPGSHTGGGVYLPPPTSTPAITAPVVSVPRVSVPPPAIIPAASVPRVSVPTSYPGVSSQDAAILSRRDTHVAELINNSGNLSPAQVSGIKSVIAGADKTPVVANAANSTARPLAGFGGGDYNKDGWDVANGIYQNEQKLLADAKFIAAEETRAAEVKKVRELAHVSTAEQDNYIAHMHDVEAKASHTSSSGGTVNRAPAPSPVPMATGMSYTPTQQAAIDNSLSQMKNSGYTTPSNAPIQMVTSSSPTISQAEYNVLAARVNSGDFSALEQLKGKRVV